MNAFKRTNTEIVSSIESPSAHGLDGYDTKITAICVTPAALPQRLSRKVDKDGQR